MQCSQLNVWADDDTRRKLTELARLWSPVKPLSISIAVRECVRRVHENETKKEKRR
jgi:hypothetical protein